MAAKNGAVKLSCGEMDYIRFGGGEKHLIFLPGLGDGLQTVKGTTLPMSLMYRVFAKKYTAWMFSRKRDLPRGYTNRDMAVDQAEAMDILGISGADVVGVSMVGMIAQHLAIDHPKKVRKLVLTVTCSRPNPILTESVEEWVSCARRGDHTALMDSNVRRIYSGEYYRRNKWLVPIMGKATKPKSYERFFVQANACLTHDAYEELHRVCAPTLVIGGEKDNVLGGDASRELAEKIPNCLLWMYEKWGHGLYEEEKSFNREVMGFLKP